MELELGLKITKTGDNFTSSDLRITKDCGGPLFVSRETETTFILTAHLKGFRRDRIIIEITEDGNRISISGDKPIKEMVMVKWRIYNKEVEIKGFRKVFWIPDGVTLNKIKARFNEEDGILSIAMPKSKRGIQGIEMCEVKDEMVEGESSGTTPPAPESKQLNTNVEENKSKTQSANEDEAITTLNYSTEKEVHDEIPSEFPEIGDSETIAEEVAKNEVPHQPEPPDEHQKQGMQNVDNLEKFKEPEALSRKEEDTVTRTKQSGLAKIKEELQDEQVRDKESEREASEIYEEEKQKLDEEGLDEDEKGVGEGDLGFGDGGNECSEGREQAPPRSFRLCAPCIFAGSAFLGFLIVLVIQLIKKHKDSNKR